MRRIFWRTIALVASLTTSALAADQKDHDDCNQTVDQDRRISGCTRVIEDRHETPENRALAYLGRGDTNFFKKDLDSAISDYTAVISLFPKAARAYNNRGASWAQKGDLGHAIADLNESLRLDPRAEYAFTQRGYVNLRLGHIDDAIADFDAALKAAVKDSDAEALYGRGIAKLRKGDAESGKADVVAAKTLRANVVDIGRKYYHVTPEGTPAPKN